MRQIKFRVWDGRDMRFYLDGFNSYMDVLVDVWEWFKVIEYPVMQFTGLTDKNGVEIYEGDVFKKEQKLNILLSGSYSTVGFVYYKVCFDKGRFFGEQISFDESLFNYFSKNKIYHNLKENLSNIEVIGNIYSNPELLK